MDQIVEALQSIEGPEANYRNAKKLAREAGRGCLDWTRDETRGPRELAGLHVYCILVTY